MRCSLQSEQSLRALFIASKIYSKDQESGAKEKLKLFEIAVAIEPLDKKTPNLCARLGNQMLSPEEVAREIDMSIEQCYHSRQIAQCAKRSEQTKEAFLRLIYKDRPTVIQYLEKEQLIIFTDDYIKTQVELLKFEKDHYCCSIQ